MFTELRRLPDKSSSDCYRAFNYCTRTVLPDQRTQICPSKTSVSQRIIELSTYFYSTATVVHTTDVSSLSGRPIEVFVGLEPPTPFSVHEKLICASSDFFRNAMARDWKESKQRSIHLKDDDADTFELYLHWLYRGTLPVRINEPGLVGNSEYLQMAKAYVLGDKLQDGDFKDVIIDAIIDKCKSIASDGHKWSPVGPVLRCIYDNTPTSSKARRLLVDIYVHNGSGDWLSDWVKQDDIPKDFLLDIAMAFLNKKEKNEESPTHKSSTCAYHQHGLEETLCYKARLRNGIVTKIAL
jgi:hypothetical protein